MSWMAGWQAELNGISTALYSNTRLALEMSAYSYPSQPLESTATTSPSSTQTSSSLHSSADEECKSTSASHLTLEPTLCSPSSIAAHPLSLSSKYGELQASPNSVNTVSTETLPQSSYTHSSQQFASSSVLPLSSTCGMGTVNRETRDETRQLGDEEELINLELSDCSFSSQREIAGSPDNHGISGIDNSGCSVQVDLTGLPMEDPGNRFSLISDNSEQSGILSDESNPLLSAQQSNTENSCKANSEGDTSVLPKNHDCACKSSEGTNGQGPLSSKETNDQCQGCALSSKETNDQCQGSALSSKETNDQCQGSALSSKETNDQCQGSALSSKETNDQCQGSALSSSGINDQCEGSALRSNDSSSKLYNFVIFSHEDDTDAADRIFLLLEQKHHLRGFKQGRDDMPGTFKSDEVVKAIENSEKILLLLTPKSVDNEHFKLMMHLSLTHSVEGGNSVQLIPICCGIKRPQTPAVLRSKYSINYDGFSTNFQTRLSGIFHSRSSLTSSVSKQSCSSSVSPTCSKDPASIKLSVSPKFKQCHSVPSSSPKKKRWFDRWLSSPK